MIYSKSVYPIIFFGCFLFLFCSCRNGQVKKKPPEKDLVKRTGQMQERISEDLQKILDYLNVKDGRLNDSVSIAYVGLLDSFYETNNYQPLWSKDEKWLPLEDSLYSFIENSKDYGLFPADYHFRSLAFINRVFLADTLAKKNAVLWARADVLLTDAFFTLVKHLKQGRFKYDSVTLRTDTVLKDQIYLQTLDTSLRSGSIREPLHHLEPRYAGYDSLKAQIKNYLAKAVFTPYTYLYYPYKDSVSFFKSLQRRLQELGILSHDTFDMDTTAFVIVLKKYQRTHGLKVTGGVSDQLVDNLNNTDWERFKSIAVNLDRYKLLPDSLPQSYVWVNLPSFYMKVIDDDTLAFQSKVIVGRPDARTPLLTSEISNFVTFPQWTVPYSIIFKEMLPKIQENVEYLNKENLMVVDKNDSVLDPHKIRWERISKKNFPYLIKQRQGDDNSLGVIKFNFRNKYSVYLHDTNVRWLFGKSFRALSHGCVRVKEWKKLANFLLRSDSTGQQADSLKAWIGRQEKHTINGFPKLPVFIRYFTCDARSGKIKFYEDIYEEDRFLREKYFTGKTVN